MKINIIDKYIIKEFLIPFSYCFLAFVLLFIIGDLFENLDNFIKQKVPWPLVGKYYLFLIPNVFILTTPLAVLLSLLYLLGYMSRYNELNALKASGVSFWRIMVPFCFIGIIFSLLVFGINERLLPPCTAEMDYIRSSYIEKKTATEKTKEIKKMTFFSSAYNMSFYIDKIAKDRKNVEGISIREFYDGGTLKKEWYGEKGIWLDNSWWLFKGYLRRYTPSGELEGSTQFFKKREIPVNIPPKDLICIQKDIGRLGIHMNFRELRNYIRRSYTRNTLPKELVIDLYRKLSIPITVLIVTIFGVAFGSRITKGGALASVGSSIGFYLMYYGMSSLLLALGKLGKLIPSLAVWTPQIVFGIIGILILRKTR